MLSRSAWNRPYRPYRARRRGISESAVFGLLLLIVSIEGAWWLYPTWRGLLNPAVVLADSTTFGRVVGAPIDPSAQSLVRADAALAQGDWAEANAAFDRAVELDAAPPTAALHSARMLLNLHRIDEAIVRARRAVTLAPGSADARVVLATALDWGGQAEEAVDVARQAHELAPTDARAAAALAEALADRQQFDEADELIAQALDQAPADPEIHRVQGAILEVHADYPGAVEAYGRALALDPNTSHRHLSLGLTLRAMNRLDEAQAACSRAIELAPTDARTHGCLGLTMLARGQVSRAIPLFEHALELDPRYPTAAAQLGWIASRRGEDARAVPYFEVAVAADRETARLAQYRQALGWSYLRVGRAADAREQFTQALRVDPSLQGARDGLLSLTVGRQAPR